MILKLGYFPSVFHCLNIYCILHPQLSTRAGYRVALFFLFGISTSMHLLHVATVSTWRLN